MWVPVLDQSGRAVGAVQVPRKTFTYWLSILARRQQPGSASTVAGGHVPCTGSGIVTGVEVKLDTVAGVAYTATLSKWRRDYAHVVSSSDRNGDAGRAHGRVGAVRAC
jgi:hypothetical protein